MSVGSETNAVISPKGDIETRADCERLVRAFYGRALHDEVIGFLFTDVAHLDLEEHVPQITSFWETMLLGAQSYDGRPFRPHIELNYKARLKPGHFMRWLALWTSTVDELFEGPTAEDAKAHATRVARAFSERIQNINAAIDTHEAAPDSPRLTVIPPST
jgi:hemoglobin